MHRFYRFNFLNVPYINVITRKVNSPKMEISLFERLVNVE